MYVNFVRSVHNVSDNLGRYFVYDYYSVLRIYVYYSVPRSIYPLSYSVLSFLTRVSLIA